MIDALPKDWNIHQKKEHHWVGEPPDPYNSFGFLYAIMNLTNGRIYIGKKQYWSRRRVGKPGTKRRKIKTSPNKWEFYTGSSKELNEDIEKLGKEYFIFMLLENISTKGALHYAEIDLQVTLEVLLKEYPDGTPVFYNKNIAGCKFKPQGTVSKETRERMAKSIKAFSSSKTEEERREMLSNNNTICGRLITHSGKTQNISDWAEEYGIKPNTLTYRLRRGWTFEESIGEKGREFIANVNIGDKKYHGRATEEDVQYIKDMLEEGESTLEIGETIGFDPSQISRIASRFGFKKKDSSQDKLKEAVELRETCRTVEEVAERMGKSVGTVYTYLREAKKLGLTPQ